jgi:predicted DCC family thiol-disulfide oxidoreductase YuxK
MPDLNQSPTKIKIFYDGRCYLCDAEIRHYLKKDHQGLLEGVDITHPQFDANKYGLDAQKVNLELHVLNEKNQQVFVGIEAFRAIWLALPRHQWLAHMINLPLIKQVSHWSYKLFAYHIRPKLPQKKCAYDLKTE